MRMGFAYVEYKSIYFVYKLSSSNYLCHYVPSCKCVHFQLHTMLSIKSFLGCRSNIDKWNVLQLIHWTKAEIDKTAKKPDGADCIQWCDVQFKMDLSWSTGWKSKVKRKKQKKNTDFSCWRWKCPRFKRDEINRCFKLHLRKWM